MPCATGGRHRRPARLRYRFGRPAGGAGRPHRCLRRRHLSLRQRRTDGIRQRLESQRPLLGVCLGAQRIARALGASVASMGVKEIGFAPLKLTPEGESSPLAAPGESFGAALAWRRFRDSRRGNASGRHVNLRQPGIRCGTPCAGAAMPLGGRLRRMNFTGPTGSFTSRLLRRLTCPRKAAEGDHLSWCSGGHAGYCGSLHSA